MAIDSNTIVVNTKARSKKGAVEEMAGQGKVSQDCERILEYAGNVCVFLGAEMGWIAELIASQNTRSCTTSASFTRSSATREPQNPNISFLLTCQNKTIANTITRSAKPHP
jgi:hypothetical protein